MGYHIAFKTLEYDCRESVVCDYVAFLYFCNGSDRDHLGFGW